MFLLTFYNLSFDRLHFICVIVVVFYLDYLLKMNIFLLLLFINCCNSSLKHNDDNNNINLSDHLHPVKIAFDYNFCKNYSIYCSFSNIQLHLTYIIIHINQIIIDNQTHGQTVG
jgi:hypothetical protein